MFLYVWRNIFVYFVYLQFPGDIWHVVEDYKATNDQELSIQQGQHVEVLDTAPATNQNWCLVRHLPLDNGSTPTEGLVPMANIKQVPNLKVSSSRTSIENEGQ